MERNLRLTLCLSGGPSRKWLAMLNGGPATDFAHPTALTLFLIVPLSHLLSLSVSLPPLDSRTTANFMQRFAFNSYVRRALPLFLYITYSLAFSLSFFCHSPFCKSLQAFTIQSVQGAPSPEASTAPARRTYRCPIAKSRKPITNR